MVLEVLETLMILMILMTLVVMTIIVIVAPLDLQEEEMTMTLMILIILLEGTEDRLIVDLQATHPDLQTRPQGELTLQMEEPERILWPLAQTNT